MADVEVITRPRMFESFQDENGKRVTQLVEDKRFRLNICVDSQEELMPYIKANDMVSALDEIRNRLRNLSKYGAGEPLTSEAFYEILESYGIDLDVL